MKLGVSLGICTSRARGVGLQLSFGGPGIESQRTRIEPRFCCDFFFFDWPSSIARTCQKSFADWCFGHLSPRPLDSRSSLTQIFQSTIFARQAMVTGSVMLAHINSLSRKALIESLGEPFIVMHRALIGPFLAQVFQYS